MAQITAILNNQNMFLIGNDVMSALLLSKFIYLAEKTGQTFKFKNSEIMQMFQCSTTLAARIKRVVINLPFITHELKGLPSVSTYTVDLGTYYQSGTSPVAAPVAAKTKPLAAKTTPAKIVDETDFDTIANSDLGKGLNNTQLKKVRGAFDNVKNKSNPLGLFVKLASLEISNKLSNTVKKQGAAPISSSDVIKKQNEQKAFQASQSKKAIEGFDVVDHLDALRIKLMQNQV